MIGPGMAALTTMIASVVRRSSASRTSRSAAVGSQPRARNRKTTPTQEAGRPGPAPPPGPLPGASTFWSVVALPAVGNGDDGGGPKGGRRRSCSVPALQPGAKVGAPVPRRARGNMRHPGWQGGATKMLRKSLRFNGKHLSEHLLRSYKIWWARRDSNP